MVCPACGQKMRTKNMVNGVVRCPKCQHRFRTSAPTPVQVNAQVSAREKEERTRTVVMAAFGALFLFGGLLAVVLDFDNLASGWASFYLAPIFCGLFFLTPAVFAGLRKRRPPVDLSGAKHPTHSTTPVSATVPVNRTAENIVMSVFGSMFVLMAVVSISIVIVIAVFLFLLIGGLGGIEVGFRP